MQVDLYYVFNTYYDINNNSYLFISITAKYSNFVEKFNRIYCLQIVMASEYPDTKNWH